MADDFVWKRFHKLPGKEKEASRAPLVAEVKARKDGQGFAQLERWLESYDLLFLRRNHADPLVAMPWRIWTAHSSQSFPRKRRRPGRSPVSRTDRPLSTRNLKRFPSDLNRRDSQRVKDERIFVH